MPHVAGDVEDLAGPDGRPADAPGLVLAERLHGPLEQEERLGLGVAVERDDRARRQRPAQGERDAVARRLRLQELDARPEHVERLELAGAEPHGAPAGAGVDRHPATLTRAARDDARCSAIVTRGPRAANVERPRQDSNLRPAA